MIAQSPHVLHDKERWPQLVHEAEEVPQQGSAWVVGFAVSDVAKRLTGRATEDAEDAAPGLALDISPRYLREVGEHQLDGREVAGKRGGQDRVDVESDSRGKARRVCPKREASAAAKEVDDPRLRLQVESLRPMMRFAGLS